MENQIVTKTESRMNLSCQTVFTGLLLLASDLCFAQKIPSGVKTIQSQIVAIGMVLGPLSLIIAAYYYFSNKQQGNEKLESVLIGIVVMSNATTIFTMIYSAFN